MPEGGLVDRNQGTPRIQDDGGRQDELIGAAIIGMGQSGKG